MFFTVFSLSGVFGAVTLDPFSVLALHDHAFCSSLSHIKKEFPDPSHLPDHQWLAVVPAAVLTAPGYDYQAAVTG